MTDYSFVTDRPGGMERERAIESIDDVWWRSVTMRIDGFASKGQEVIGTIIELTQPPTFQIVAYKVQTDTVDVLEVPQQFLKMIPSACRKSIRAIGTTPEGDPVLGIKGNGCEEAWTLTQGPLIDGAQKPAHATRLAHGAMIDPLER